MKNLSETINTQKEALKNFNSEIFEIPSYITANLKHTFFDWQKEAFENFLTYKAIKQKENPNGETHLMFNMATGTGKTLLMAATILYYYQQGYRHFLFFVNQNNIIDKTENNFIENSHPKYLFTEKIIIEDQTVDIQKVNTFSDEPQGIEIKFTSIQKLYNDIHLERENQTTLKDLQSKKIVMLADEAHHLNANTKNLDFRKEMFGEKLKGSKDEVEKKGWEHTVIELILKKQGTEDNNNVLPKKQGTKDNNNVLLEFTATIPANRQVAYKYKDKTIYKFTLEQFLQKGYTKEINLISSTLAKKERILQALLFQWYRHKIAVKHNIANFKPVILFRSKTIVESKADYEDFSTWIDQLSSADFDFLKNIDTKIFESKKPAFFEMGKSRTVQVLEFIQKQNVNYTEIAEWLKQNYAAKNTIITNSETNKTKTEKTTAETEKLLNSLEAKNNYIRAIFTVDRLTEGWDVLNLFDIVRLYQGQNAGGTTKKTPEATTKEKQLIGRGVRYFPFSYDDKLKNKRKFDQDLNHELRILEELFYYTYDENSRYISHLKQELKKDGYLQDDNKIVKTFALKADFKESDFYKKTKIWYNKAEDNPKRRKQNLKTIQKDFSFTYTVQGLEQKENSRILNEKTEIQKQVVAEKNRQTTSVLFKNIEKHIFQKAVNIKAKADNALFRFENLSRELQISSVEDLRKDQFLGNFNLKITAPTNYQNIPNREKLNAVLKFLKHIETELKAYINPKIGSEFKAANFEKFFAQPKVKAIEQKHVNDEIATDNEWYVLDGFVGTSEEKALLDFIKDRMGNLETKYDEIYLLRNEEVYKIYDFEKGRGFQPDFLLFLKGKNDNLHYQIFIEPKGDTFKDLSGGFKNSKEGWKEAFLEQITQKYGFENIITAENPAYRLIGLPFFNANNSQRFAEQYQKLA